jgi:guanine deaminase
MKIYRSALLRFADDGTPLYDSDGLLAVAPDAQGQERVVAAGSWQALHAEYAAQANAHILHLPGKLIAPGFVDMHIHYPQTDVIGAPADGLLPWLEHYTFPHEARFHGRSAGARHAHAGGQGAARPPQPRRRA